MELTTEFNTSHSNNNINININRGVPTETVHVQSRKIVKRRKVPLTYQAQTKKGKAQAKQRSQLRKSMLAMAATAEQDIRWWCLHYTVLEPELQESFTAEVFKQRVLAQIKTDDLVQMTIGFQGDTGGIVLGAHTYLKPESSLIASWQVTGLGLEHSEISAEQARVALQVMGAQGTIIWEEKFATKLGSVKMESDHNESVFSGDSSDLCFRSWSETQSVANHPGKKRRMNTALGGEGLVDGILESRSTVSEYAPTTRRSQRKKQERQGLLSPAALAAGSESRSGKKRGEEQSRTKEASKKDRVSDVDREQSPEDLPRLVDDQGQDPGEESLEKMISEPLGEKDPGEQEDQQDEAQEHLRELPNGDLDEAIIDYTEEVQPNTPSKIKSRTSKKGATKGVCANCDKRNERIALNRLFAYHDVVTVIGEGYFEWTRADAAEKYHAKYSQRLRQFYDEKDGKTAKGSARDEIKVESTASEGLDQHDMEEEA